MDTVQSICPEPRLLDGIAPRSYGRQYVRSSATASSPPKRLAAGARTTGMSTDYRPGFETQRKELRDERLPVEGSLPAWLRGRYLQNGPGQFEADGEPLNHWFDPYAMLRRVTFDDDGVRYANRFVESEDLAFERSGGGVRTPFPGTAPDRPVWTRLRQALTGVFPDNPIIGVARRDGEPMAVTESPWGLRFDPETLATEERVDLTVGLGCDLTLGHLHRDPDGTVLNLGVSYGRETTYTLFRRDGGEATPLATLRFDEAPYVHSFAVTERYAVVTVGGYGLDLSSLLVGSLTGTTFLDAFGPLEGPTRFVVLDRMDGERVATVPADPFFVYHHANAYEDGDELVVDLVAFDDEFVAVLVGVGVVVDEERVDGDGRDPLAVRPVEDDEP